MDMEFEEVIKQRRSVRKFQEKEIPDMIIRKMLGLANLSPSAGNLQARKVVVVKDRGIKEKLARVAGGQDFLAEAPVVFVICADPEESAKRYGERGKRLYAIQDATVFTSYLQLAVTSFGLSSCWIGAFNEEEVAGILDLPQTVRPVAIIPVGYANESPSRRPRKDLEEIIIKL